MKYTLLFSLLIICNTTIGQKKTESEILMDRMIEYNIPHKDGFPFYELIDSGLNKSKAEIHRAARNAIAKSFGDSKEVLRVDDIDAGTLVGKGRTTFMWSTLGMPVEVSIPFIIEINSREGKYRIQLKDLTKIVNGDFGKGVETTLYRMAKAGDGYNKKLWPKFDKELNEVLSMLQSKIRAELKYSDSF